MATSRSTSCSADSAPTFTFSVVMPRARMARAEDSACARSPAVTVMSMSSSVPAPPKNTHSGTRWWRASASSSAVSRPQRAEGSWASASESHPDTGRQARASWPMSRSRTDWMAARVPRLGLSAHRGEGGRLAQAHGAVGQREPHEHIVGHVLRARGDGERLGEGQVQRLGAQLGDGRGVHEWAGGSATLTLALSRRERGHSSFFTDAAAPARG